MIWTIQCFETRHSFWNRDESSTKFSVGSVGRESENWILLQGEESLLPHEFSLPSTWYDGEKLGTKNTSQWWNQPTELMTAHCEHSLCFLHAGIGNGDEQKWKIISRNSNSNIISRACGYFFCSECYGKRKYISLCGASLHNLRFALVPREDVRQKVHCNGLESLHQNRKWQCWSENQKIANCSWLNIKLFCIIFFASLEFQYYEFYILLAIKSVILFESWRSEEKSFS